MTPVAATPRRTTREDRVGRPHAPPRRQKRTETPAPAAFAPRRRAPAYADLPPPIATRMIGLAGTALIGLAVIGAGLVEWTGESSVRTSAASLTLVEISQPEAPPIPPSEIPPGPESIEQEQRSIEMPRPVRMQRQATPSSAPTVIRETIGRLSAGPVDLPAPASAPTSLRPARRTTSPEAHSLPPGPKANDARPKWEGLVLAALNRAKRYPRAARRRQQEGTSWIAFVIDRRGRIRSLRLERSSGVDALDREALALPERAQPLPRPPKSIAGERIELVVPIEFFIR